MTEARPAWRRFLQFRLRSLLLLLTIAGVAATWYARQPAPLRLGLEGYCPVSLVHEETWTKGRVKHQAELEGVLYLFAGPEERRLFEAAPTPYLPVCSGEDVVRLLDEQRHSVGRRAHGLFFQERIFLFDSEETLGKFWGDPSRYAAYAIPRPTDTASR
jgi:YHS domain-containing protein